MLKANRPDSSNYFNYKNGCVENTSCCAATGKIFLTLPGVAAMYTFLLNTWKTILESYQQRVNKNTLAAVKRQIQQVEDPLSAMMIDVEAARVENAIFLHYLPSKVALKYLEIGCTDPNIPIDNHCLDVQPHFGMPEVSGEYNEDRDPSNARDTVLTANRQQSAVTVHGRFDLGTSQLNTYECADDDNADANDEDEALQAEHESKQYLED